MNATRQYRIYSGIGTTGDNIANLRIVRNGWIQSVLWSISAVAGAAVNSCLRLQISKSSASFFTTNDIPPSVISDLCLPFAISGGAAGLNILHAGLWIPVASLDFIYLHQIFAGTATGSNVTNVIIGVSES